MRAMHVADLCQHAKVQRVKLLAGFAQNRLLRTQRTVQCQPDALNLVQLKRQAASNNSFHSCHCSDTYLQKFSSSRYFPVPTKSEEIWNNSGCAALRKR